MPEQFGERSHEATPHKRQQAREQGQIAKSQDLASAATLLAVLVAMVYSGRRVSGLLHELTRRQLSIFSPTLDRQSTMAELFNLLVAFAYAIAPLLLVAAGAAVAANVMQTGLLFLPQRLKLDISHISPAKGIQRIFSSAAAARLGFGVFKVLVVAVVAGVSLWLRRGEIISLTSLEAGQMASFLFDILFWTAVKVAAALLALALFDYLFQRWKVEQDLRMTTQELREEMKTLEGDPHMRARRRAVQQQLAGQRLSTAVGDADVTVTNPTELAVSLKYDMQTMSAPIVVAKGEGVMAQRIRRLSLEKDVPIVERKPLARALYKKVEVGQSVPPAEYAAVAEVLKYVYELKGKPLPGAA